MAAGFGLTEDQYAELLAFQNYRCYICQRPARNKRLAVDHDHSCTAGHDPKIGCTLCIRGLLDKNCNFYVLGRLGDDPVALQRGIDYLVDPPYQRLLRGKL